MLGDFGVIWDKNERRSEKYKLDSLDKKPFTTVFVEGNHENHKRLNSYPVSIWNGGRVHKIRPNVIHLMRGEIFNIEETRFFTFGGAASHDVQDGILEYDNGKWLDKAYELENQGKFNFRVKDVSWWEEELPNEREMKCGFHRLEEVGNKVDFILTHSPSTSDLYLIGGSKCCYRPDILTNYLEEVKSKVEYKKHFFGHMHMNYAVNDKDICLYDQIIRIL